MTYSLGRHAQSGLVAKAADGVEELTSDEQDALLASVVSESTALTAARPERFMKLQREVEVVTLDRLIEAFEQAPTNNTDEAFWQHFFDENAFALHQVFGSPMINGQSGA